MDDDRRKLERLAGLVIAMLDAQREYFQHRTKASLNHSIDLERELRKQAEAILAPLEQQALIIDEGQYD
jgi:Na+/phosphate symporter